MTLLSRSLGLACFALVLALTGCTDAGSNPAPSATPQAGTSQTPPKPTGVASEPLVFRYENAQMRDAVPPRYRNVAMDVDSIPFNPNATYTPRPDPLAGRSIEPESCRPMVWGIARPVGQYGGLPSETPSGFGFAELGRPVAGIEPHVSVLHVELTGAKAAKFLDILPPVGSECTNVRITDGPTVGEASAVERSLPEFGAQSRYIVRSYPRGGSQWIERVLLFPSARYVTEVRAYGSRDSEAAFLTFAREVRDRAARKLK